jgi:hypothetical protein
MNINTTSSEKFYESYKNYFINTIKIDKEDKIYEYVFYCRDSSEIFFLKGNSMNEIYYKILFEIDYNCCDDIYVYIDSEYSIEDFEDPIQLLKTHYFDSDYYVFTEIKYMKYDINNIEITNNADTVFNESYDKYYKSKYYNNININTLNEINNNTEKEFNESYEKYYLSKYINQSNENSQSVTHKYIFISCKYGEVFFIEGKSMEEVYYIILFKIEDILYKIYDAEYSMIELKDPIKLFNNYFVNSDKYIFEKIQL